MTTDDRRVAEALAEIERLKAERDHLRKVIDNGLRDYMTLEAERDALRADAERAMRILMDAPGLPLEIADVDELVKWTDAIAAVLIVLSDYADAALAAKEGK